MLDRRNLLIATAALMSPIGAALAADWKSEYPELIFAVVPAENASGVSDRFAPFMTYLSTELGVPVTLRLANDYAAVIEGQRAGNIQIAFYGPASYSTAYLTGVKTEPFVTTRNNDGAIGYYSVIYVKADSPYKEIQDLKGKTIGFVDPNSTSGYNAPRFFLHKVGIDVDSFFGKSIITGSHLPRVWRKKRISALSSSPGCCRARPTPTCLASPTISSTASSRRSWRRQQKTRLRSIAYPTGRTRSSSRSRTRITRTSSR
jgi:phosphate/phosphite/phosphonate ABC transporter binding protein